MRRVSLLSSVFALTLTITSTAYAGENRANDPSKIKPASSTSTPAKQVKILGQSNSAAANALYYQIPEDIVLGNANAPVTVVEYSSLTCPHCAHFSNDLLPIIKKEYIDTGKVKFISRDFPLDATALKAAKLPHCAGKDRYYDFLKVLFKTQDSWARHDNFQEILGNIARLGGMSAETFNKCMDDKDLELVIADTRLQAAEQIGVSSTPTFFVNGELHKGIGSVEAFEQAVNKALAAKEKTAAVAPAPAPANAVVVKKK